MAQKPSIPKGTRDFAPQEMMRRNYIFETIKRVFEHYAYKPIETPAMENLSTLLGKYGEEGDKLLFKILNSGDFSNGINFEDYKIPLEISEDAEVYDAKKLSTIICEKGLRYDLTVPFARFVVQHQNELTFPFKRYQIQPVWRADRPQKGRYREFFQCDVDVIGSTSLLNEAELLNIIDEVYKKLNIRVVTKINNRKILAGIAETIGFPDKIVDITIAIDKLDKIGLEKVNEELGTKISAEAIAKLRPILLMKGDFLEKIETLKTTLAHSEIGLKGISEMVELFDYISDLKLDMPCELDLTLARGLNYYTGAIFEVKTLDVAMGSICGGGRYDDLTGIFGLKNMSGVGVSFGADRIYDVMSELNVFPEHSIVSSQILFVNFGRAETRFILPLLKRLREKHIACELYPDAVKMQKQFNYANDNHIPYVAIIGEDEIKTNSITVKTMQSGQQQNMSAEHLIDFLTQK
ncbi:MAG: histidine--tRNA ligase [Bacteroidales bacterium]|jgi:histidyl-tRNA synthetase|nr:histidine--tRNA ligase [Bacteroidales bacterium]